MDEQMLDDQLEPIYSNSVRIQDGAWKTCRKRWMRETYGERWSGKPMLAARDDDNDLNQVEKQISFKKFTNVFHGWLIKVSAYDTIS